MASVNVKTNREGIEKWQFKKVKRQNKELIRDSHNGKSRLPIFRNAPNATNSKHLIEYAPNAATMMESK